MENKKIVQKFRESCGEEIGYISGLFMSQGDIKASEIVMPTEELSETVDRIELYLFEALSAQKQEFKEMIESVRGIDDDRITEFVKSVILSGLKKL